MRWRAASRAMKSHAVATCSSGSEMHENRVLPAYAYREHRLVLGVDAEHPGDRDLRVLERQVDRGFAVQSPRIARPSRVRAVVSQEELVDLAVGVLDVDEPGLLAGAAGLTVGVDQTAAADVLDPRDQVVRKAHGRRHRRPAGCAAARDTSTTRRGLPVRRRVPRPPATPAPSRTTGPRPSLRTRPSTTETTRSRSDRARRGG